MSIRSCARHNGMTGAGSDRDAGPTPVQRARFRENDSRKRQRVRIYWRRLERARCTIGAGSGEREHWIVLRRTSLHSSSPLPPSTVSLRATPFRRGVRYPAPGLRVLPKTDRAGTSGTGFGACVGLQSMHHTTTHEGLIETCRRLTDHAEDPSRTARESGQKARFHDTAHGRSTREPRLCRDLQGTRWG